MGSSSGDLAQLTLYTISIGYGEMHTVQYTLSECLNFNTQNWVNIPELLLYMNINFLLIKMALSINFDAVFTVAAQQTWSRGWKYGTNCYWVAQKVRQFNIHTYLPWRETDCQSVAYFVLQVIKAATYF